MPLYSIKDFMPPGAQLAKPEEVFLDPTKIKTMTAGGGNIYRYIIIDAIRIDFEPRKDKNDHFDTLRAIQEASLDGHPPNVDF